MDCISVGVDRMQRNFESIRKEVEAHRERECLIHCNLPVSSFPLLQE